MKTKNTKDWDSEIQEAIKEIAGFLADTHNGAAQYIVDMGLAQAVQEFGSGWIYHSLRFLKDHVRRQKVEAAAIEKYLYAELKSGPVEDKDKHRDLVKFLDKLKSRGKGIDLTKSDSAVAEFLQVEEFSNIVSTESTRQRNPVKHKGNVQDGNAFNRYNDLGYWYQDLDLINIGSAILKDKENLVFIGAVGRGNKLVAGNNADAKAVLASKKEELEAGKKLVGIYNTGSNHWVAFIIFEDTMGKVTCGYKDSLGKRRNDFVNDVKQAFGEETSISCLAEGAAEQTEYLDNAIASNKGLVSCGIFALKNLGILADCSNFAEVKFYHPGRNFEEYKASMKSARREYGLLYAKKVYDALPDNENRLTDLLQELKANPREMDNRLRDELAAAIQVDADLMKESMPVASSSQAPEKKVKKEKVKDSKGKDPFEDVLSEPLGGAKTIASLEKSINKNGEVFDKYESELRKALENELKAETIDSEKLKPAYTKLADFYWDRAKGDDVVNACLILIGIKEQVKTESIIQDLDNKLKYAGRQIELWFSDKAKQEIEKAAGLFSERYGFLNIDMQSLSNFIKAINLANTHEFSTAISVDNLSEEKDGSVKLSQLQGISVSNDNQQGSSCER
ncbi:MAG: hypothetical protein K0R73_681 [Candidatus Midichloriaceae bacterium]|jgi:hypothetical protein|nr:hypothetical protein [Candidatus Midichloriaceae bacterium]